MNTVCRSRSDAKLAVMGQKPGRKPRRRPRAAAAAPRARFGLNALSAAYGLFRFATRLQRLFAIRLGGCSDSRDRLNAREPAFLAMIERTVRPHAESLPAPLPRRWLRVRDVKRLVEGEGWARCVFCTELNRSLRVQGLGLGKAEVRASSFVRVTLIMWLDVIFTRRRSRRLSRSSRSRLSGGHGAPLALWFAAHGWLTRPLVFVSPTYLESSTASSDASASASRCPLVLNR
jgi:hypothetical protein